MRQILLASILALSSCGNKNEGPPVDDNTGKEAWEDRSNTNVYDKEKGLSLTVGYFKDKELSRYLLDFATAQKNAWGKSLKTNFIPEMSAKELDEAIKYDESNIYLNKIVPTVIKRFKDRCPSTFNSSRKLFSVDVSVRKKSQDDTLAGLYGSPISWDNGIREDGQKNQSNLIIYDTRIKSKELSAKIILSEIEDSYEAIEGEKPWEWNYDTFFIDFPEYRHTQIGNGWNLGQHEMISYSDFTLAHEMGHWIIDSLVFSEGKVIVPTVYFNEVLAQFTSALCYVSHIEDKKSILDYIDAERKYYSIDKYWPLNDRTFEGRIAIVPNEVVDIQDSYEDSSQKKFGMAALVATLVAHDDFNPDFLMEKMLESISEMKGRKLECRKEDVTCSRTVLYAEHKGFSLAQKPYVLTLAEFLEIFTTKIKVPAKADNMWRSYIKIMNDVEK